MMLLGLTGVPGALMMFEPTVNFVACFASVETRGKHPSSGTCVITYDTESFAELTVPPETVKVPPPRLVTTVPALLFNEFKSRKKPPVLRLALVAFAY